MKENTILYFPDYRTGTLVAPEIMAALRHAFPYSRIISVDLERIEDYSNAADEIDSILQKENPELVIAEGLGGFFVHTLAGYDRICINPMLTPSIYIDDVDGSYRKASKEQFSYDRTADDEHQTHCWGIFGINVSKKNFCMMHYPNIISLNKTVDSILDVLDDIIVPLAHNIALSVYTDDDGVRYSNYGRTLVKADYPQFKSVEHYDVPFGVRSIGDMAFSGMELKSITLPDSVDFIGESSFSDCRSLEEITLPKNLNIVRKSCFEGCVSLCHVKIPKSLSCIQSRSFANTAIKKIALPDSIQGIAPDAFDEGVILSMSARRLNEILRDSQNYQLSLSI